jgi:adenylosuccinate lyase
LAGVVDKLVIYPERMKRNLDLLGGLVHSQRVLLALTQAGASREDSYKLVQRNAMPVWRNMQNGVAGPSFLDNLKADAEVGAFLKPAALDGLFDDAFHFKHVDTIFARVFGR